jgi:hypothetical protein
MGQARSSLTFYRMIFNVPGGTRGFIWGEFQRLRSWLISGRPDWDEGKPSENSLSEQSEMCSDKCSAKANRARPLCEHIGGLSEHIGDKLA